MSHLGFDFNEHGVMISKHVCDECHQLFTVCPAVAPGVDGWDRCMAPECPSYDPGRDVDRLFASDKGARLIVTTRAPRGSG